MLWQSLPFMLCHERNGITLILHFLPVEKDNKDGMVPYSSKMA